MCLMCFFLILFWHNLCFLKMPSEGTCFEVRPGRPYVVASFDSFDHRRFTCREFCRADLSRLQTDPSILFKKAGLFS